MQPLLFDRGLPPAVADALITLGLTAWAVGRGGAPPDNSADEDNCKWCKENDAVLVTTDRGRKNREIAHALELHRVHAIFVYDDLRSEPPHNLARALLAAEGKMDQLVKRGLIRHRLTPNGRLTPRPKSGR